MRFLLSIILFISVVRFGAVAFAEKPPITPIPPTTPHKTSVPVVVSVDATTITVQNGIHAGMKVTHHDEDDQKQAGAQKKLPANIRVYTVTRFTEITINGHRSTLSDIKAGMPVRVTAGITPTEAAKIAAKVDRSVMIPIP